MMKLQGRNVVGGGAMLLAASLIATAGANPVVLSHEIGGNLGFRIDGPMADALVGTTIRAAGDVNGDGYPDIIVGRGTAAGSSTEIGEAYVIHGTEEGIPHVDLSRISAGMGGGFVIRGILATDNAGSAVSGIGDFNGDGLDDVIVGAPGAQVAGNARGVAYVVFGKSGTDPVLLADVELGAGGLAMRGIANGDATGASVGAAGDVNNDGFDDVIFGAPGVNVVGNDSGVAFVVYGRAETDAVDLGEIAGATGEGFAVVGHVAAAEVGTRVAGLGDINGDGLDDLFVSGHASSPEGVGWIVFGKSDFTGVNTSGLLAAAPAGFAVLGTNPDDFAGFTGRGVGDVNGDGLEDILVAAPGADAGGQVNSGIAYVIHGSPDNTPLPLATVAGGTRGFPILGFELNALLGFSASPAGDVNMDGLMDFMVGAFSASPNMVMGAGEVLLVYGKADGSPVNSANIRAGTGPGIAYQGAFPGDGVGYEVASLGDFSGNGRPSLGIPAPAEDARGEDAGRAYVVHTQNPLPDSSTYRRQLPAGATTRPQPIGRQGAEPVAPASRLWVGFDGGDQSLVEAEVRRSNADLVGLPSDTVANVHWRLSTPRTGYTNAEVTVTWLRSEASGLDAPALRLFHAPTPTGPWTQAASASTDAVRRRASGTIPASALGGGAALYLALSTGSADSTAPTFVVTPSGPEETAAGVAQFQVAFSEPVEPTFDISDVTLIGSLSTGATAVIAGTGPVYTVIAVPVNPEAEGTLGINITGSITDNAGNAATSGSPSAQVTLRRAAVGTQNLLAGGTPAGFESLANLDDTLWAPFTLGGIFEEPGLETVAEGLRVLVSDPRDPSQQTGGGSFGYFETVDTFGPVPEGTYKLRVVIQPQNPPAPGNNYPEMRFRLSSPDGLVNQFASYQPSNPTRPFPDSLSILFESDGSQEYRLSLEVLDFQSNTIDGGFLVEEIELLQYGVE